VLFAVANAAYRSATRDGAVGPEAARRLDGVMQAYAGVLKANPRHADAAYNFEYVSRLRDMLARLKPVPLGSGDEPRGAGRIQTSDLPRGVTMHGAPGGPPVNVPMEEFEILIPREAGEQETSPGQAEGGRLRRKG
jgi:hypothetical protein